MMNAQQIVEMLLEDEVVRVCAGCQQEFGAQPPPNASHGYCKRHTLGMYQQMLDMVGNSPKAQGIQQKMQEVQQKPDSAFPPDLAQQRQQADVAQ